MSFLTNIAGNTKVGQPGINYSVPGFTGGGLNGSFDNNHNIASVTADPNRTDAVGNLASTYGALGDQTGALRATVAPGFNDMLSARLNSLNTNAASAIGTLNQNLQSRRVLGSSFGQDTISRAQNQIQQERDSLIADNFQKSLQANNQLLTQQYDAYSKQFQTGLNELDLEARTASGLQAGAAQILAQNAQAQAKLTESANEFNAKMSNDQASGIGSFLGRAALAPVTGGGSLLGNATSGLFKMATA